MPSSGSHREKDAPLGSCRARVRSSSAARPDLSTPTSIAPQHEHVKRQRGNEQRPGHEAQIEVDQNGNRDQSEAETDSALKNAEIAMTMVTSASSTPLTSA